VTRTTINTEGSVAIMQSDRQRERALGTTVRYPTLRVMLERAEQLKSGGGICGGA